MRNAIKVRQAAKDDVPAMVELWKEMMDFHKDRDPFFTMMEAADKRWIEFITGHISNEDSCVLVAECGGQIVGHGLALIAERPPVFTTRQYGLFQELAVTNDYRRTGVGEKLVKQIYEWYLSKNIRCIEVRVSVHNELSTAFWRKMGFKPYLETLSLEI